MEPIDRWRIGEVEISRIPEFEMPMFEPSFIYPTLAAETLERHRAWLSPRHLDPATGRLVISVHGLVIRTNRRTILVDACGGNDKNRPGRPHFHMQRRPWLERLAAAGFHPPDIDFVLCTHLHTDHVGWNTRLVDGRWVPTFPRARYLFAQAEWDYWRDETHRKPGDTHYADSVLPVVESGQAEFVATDYAFDDEVRLEPTPGHTPGHVAVHVRSGDHEALLTGDMMHTALQCAEPEISSGFCVDPAQAARTRRAVLERCAERPIRVLPAHFPSPSAGFIRSEGGAFRFHYVG